MNFNITPLTPFGLLISPKIEGTSIREVNIGDLRELLQKEQLLALRGFRTFESTSDFAEYGESWGEIALWPFGKVLELIQQENPADHIFDNSYVPLHWDGMYRPQIPEYQIFHCVKAPLPDQGGRTTFSNTLLVLQNSSLEEKAVWKKVTGIYHRRMEYYNSVTESPIITQHPYRDYSVIRYNEPPSQNTGKFVNPPQMEFKGIEWEERELFQESLNKALYHPQHFYAHEWQQGDVVIADNFSLLHGREAFTSRSPRHIQRIQILSNPPYDNASLRSYL